jgi:hypothetical protein
MMSLPSGVAMNETKTIANYNERRPTTGIPGMISTKIVMDSAGGFNMTHPQFCLPFKGVKGNAAIRRKREFNQDSLYLI